MLARVRGEVALLLCLCSLLEAAVLLELAFCALCELLRELLLLRERLLTVRGLSLRALDPSLFAVSRPLAPKRAHVRVERLLVAALGLVTALRGGDRGARDRARERRRELFRDLLRDALRERRQLRARVLLVVVCAREERSEKFDRESNTHISVTFLTHIFFFLENARTP